MHDTERLRKTMQAGRTAGATQLQTTRIAHKHMKQRMYTIHRRSAVTILNKNESTG